MDFETLRSKLLLLDTACLCDANKQLRVMDTAIRPVQTGLKLIGRARTVVCDDDFLTLIKSLAEAEMGEVLVVDTRNSKRAVAGELFSTEAMRKGLAGIVVDGAVRDTAKLRKLPLPVYSRAITPVAGTTGKICPMQIPVVCGGVVVHPGDIIIGDDDGIVIATAAEITELIARAETIQHHEEKILPRIEQGESLLQMLNFDTHYATIMAGKESKLRFDL